jgi:hypothetical protein
LNIEYLVQNKTHQRRRIQKYTKTSQNDHIKKTKINNKLKMKNEKEITNKDI